MIALTKEIIQKNVATNFRYVRYQYGITISEMAERLGMHEKTLGAIENRGVNTPLHVYKLACLTNISMQTIYTTELNASNNNPQ